ncbi:MAG: Holliday junction branch migration protein RuvA [Deltaproteobacteria bacterium]|nr:Holliday junction branch migration protein RuvA [Deltaproteobacteria bacterium]
MIARLSGRLIHKGTESVVVDAGGVGYEVFIPLSTFYMLPDLNEAVTLSVHTHLREDAIQLYGFLTDEEKSAFGLLIGVSGIGPRLARNILSGITVAELVGALSSSDKARLSTIPGIGAKSAERMILELKDKVKGIEHSKPHDAAHKTDTMTSDVISALDNLGYKGNSSSEAVRKAKAHLKPGFGFEELFKESLKALAKK